MWESLKEQIIEIGSANLIGENINPFIKDGNVIFVYEQHKLLIPLNDNSPIVIRHIGKGTVKLTFKRIEVLGKLEMQ